MFVKKKLSTKLHRVPFRVQYEKILSLEIFYTHAVADKYQVCPDAPYDGFTEAERNAVHARWAKTKIRCGFDGRVAYSEFLAKKVAKVFPDIVPPSLWKNFDSTSKPSTRHCLVVKVFLHCSMFIL